MRMAMDVGERFLNNAKYRQLYVKAQSVQFTLCGQGHRYAAAFTESLHISAESPAQAKCLKKWWVQEIRNGAQLVGAFVNQPHALFNHGTGCRGDVNGLQDGSHVQCECNKIL